VLGLGDDLQAYADTLEKIAAIDLKKGIVGLKALLRTRYSDYVLAVRQKALIQERIVLAKRLEAIAKTRYEEGGGTKARLMQAAIQRMNAESKLLEQERRIQARYYTLLAAAQTDAKPDIEAVFLYPISRATANATPSNPTLERIEAEAKRFEAKAKIENRSLKRWQIFTEYEKEPDQSIFRVGISIPIALHHDRSEERMLARLKSRQVALEREQLKATLFNQKEMLKSAIRELSAQYHALLSLQKEQRELTALLQEGYTIAKGSLFELMVAKNRLIQTRKQLLETQKTLNEKKIALRYLTGAYND